MQLLAFATTPSEEEQGAHGAQRWSVLSVLDRASTGARELLPLGVEWKKRSRGFTLLEILIALALIAILMVAAAPYMADAWKKSPEEEVARSLEDLVAKTRAEAITTGETRFIALDHLSFVPIGWKIEIKRLTDSQFRPLLPEEWWQFHSEGMCDPITLRLIGGREPLVIKFDPITGQIIDNEE